MRVFQNGACMGDSDGGAFMRINGEIRHIGTITAIQSGLCGSNAATDLNGKSISPSNSFHTTVLSW